MRAKGLSEMGSLADAYLLTYLKKQKSGNYKNAFTFISNLMPKNANSIKIEQLAYDVNVSKRNFERRFAEQVGTSPKLFCCITRFNHALELKLKNPKSSWTLIAYECGYSNQVHLVKDFKKFAGNIPSIFLKKTPLTEEKYMSRIDT